MNYEDLDAAELRDERDFWRGKVCEYARRYTQAVDAGNLGELLGSRVALDQALAQEHRIDRMLKVGVAA